MMRCFKGLSWVFVCVCVSVSNVAADYTLMLNEFRGGKEKVRWQPLADYLTQQLGQAVKIRSIKPSGIVKRSKRADFILANPVVTNKVADQYGFKPIATLNHKKSGSQLSGLIIVREDSPIHNLQGLKGKKVAVVNKKNAAGGFMFQAYELFKIGFDPAKDFQSFLEIQNQNAIILRVIKGQLDAGFVRSGQLQQLLKQNKKVDMSQVRILNQQGDENRSTELFPHWAFSAKQDMPADVVAKVKQALLEMTPDMLASQSANIKGFVAPGDYGLLKIVMEKLKVHKFKH